MVPSGLACWVVEAARAAQSDDQLMLLVLVVVATVPVFAVSLVVKLVLCAAKLLDT